ncbi:insoluble domain protein [Rhodococcus sp. NPDC060176]|uniref:insoluble domain protein n=1 Tax=Rhodococcus sp. NPDC060176 TaxID=3347062 RepID=UPI0036484E4D
MPKKHRKPRKRWIAPTAIAAGISTSAMFGAGIAHAAPESGWSNPDPGQQAPESGWSNPTPTPTTPAPAPAPEPAPVEENRSYWTPPPPEYTDVQWRPSPSAQSPSNSGNGYTEPTYTAPVRVEDLHLPIAVDPIAPIQAPAERLRLGDFVTDQPNWLSDEYLDRTNNTAAVIEAQYGTAWKSIGVDAERSDRIAAATVAGVATGALGGAAIAGTPFAVGGALVGGTIGGNIGLTLGNVLVPGVGWVPGGVAGTAVGAGVGAAVAGVPAALVGGAVGGVAGGLAGTAFGAGDTTNTPTEFDLPDVAEPDTAAITAQVTETLAQQQPQVAEFVQDTVASAPQVVEQVTEQVATAREATLAQPGGEDVIAGLDAAAKELDYAFGPVAAMVNDAVAAATAGVNPA